MILMMKQELSNTHNIEILADISGQTLYSINCLVQSVEKINDNVSKINSKMPEPGPKPPVPPIPPKPKPPVPPVPPKPEPEYVFYCQHCNQWVLRCPQTNLKWCTYYETKKIPVSDPKKIIREREFNKWLNDKN